MDNLPGATWTTGEPVVYTDRKRLWWMLSLVFPLIPLLGLAAHAWTGHPLALALPLLISYGLMPVLDRVFGED